MKRIKNLALVIMVLGSTSLQAQKIFSEGTILYNIAIEGNNKTAGMDKAINTVYVKGTQSRVDMVSSLGTEGTVYNSKTGTAFILKEYSGQKLMITLNKQNWQDKNQSYGDINFETTQQTKVIAGYTCKQAIGKTKNGIVITAYYTPDLLVADKESRPAFKNLPGLPLEYEVNTGKMSFKYILEKISFDPVPSSKFDAPKAGYRVMTYDENKKLKQGS